MKIHLHRELDRLRQQLFHLSSVVEDNLQASIRAVLEADTKVSAAVKERDNEIDVLEVEFEEECLKILALYHPVAADLRFLISALKMNNDLERIGDLAVIIARAAEQVDGAEPPTAVAEKLSLLAEKSRRMLRDSIESLIDLDAAKARRVLAADDEVDALFSDMLQMMLQDMGQDASQSQRKYAWLRAAKSIERVGDHATNIAEDTIYAVEGEIVRHWLG